MCTFLGPQLASSAPPRRITLVIQSIPVAEEVPRLQAERNILLILCCFLPQLGCLQAGRRSGTVKADATTSITTAEPLRGQDHSFREPQMLQHRAVEVYAEAQHRPNHLHQPHHPHNPHHPHHQKSLLGALQAPRRHMNLVSCRPVGRFAVLPMEDPFSSTTSQRQLPGKIPG